MGWVMSSSGMVRIGELRHRAGPAAHAPGALEEAGEVGVHVARVAAPAGHLLARRRHLAQRLAVVGHVGEHHEHVQPVGEGEVLGAGEGAARREQPLDGRVVGPVQEHHASGPAPRPRAKRVEEGVVLAVGGADGREDHREGLALAGAHAGLADDLRGELEAGRPAHGEDRQLLPAHQRVHPVDGRDARLDEVRRLGAPGDVHGRRRAPGRSASAIGGGSPSAGRPAPSRTRPSRSRRPRAAPPRR